MPYKILKIRNTNKYKVVNIDTGKIMSKHATKENAIKQVRLLDYLRFRNDPKH